MPNEKPAARLLDEIYHTSALSGFLAGALLGLAAGIVIVAATVATGGAALAVVAAAGAAVASTGGGALVGGAIGATFSAPCGTIVAPCSFNVLINNRPAARAMIDTTLCAKDAAGPPKQIATGARTVLTNTFPAARVDESIVCGAKILNGSPDVYIGLDSAQMLAVSPEIPAWMTTTAQVMVIGGTVVALGAGAAAAFMAGGTCALIGFGGQVIGSFAFGFVGSEVGGHIGESVGGERGRIIGSEIGAFIGGFFGGRLGGRAARGHPVDMASGELFTEATDFELPGPIPLTFSRVWMSSSFETGRSGGLGARWHHSLGMRLYHWREGGGFVLRLGDGRLALFTPPTPESPSLNTVERLILETDGSTFQVRDYVGRRWLFRHAQDEPGVHLLERIADANGNAVALDYGPRDNLSRITDSAGRVLNVETDELNRIVAIDAPHPDDPDSRLVLVSYRYSSGGDLVSATDARGNSYQYSYENHLMVRERHRGGLTYVFEWDDVWKAQAARCTRTWGTSASGALTGLHFIDVRYDDLRFETAASDATGNVTVYRNDGLGKITRQIDPDGRTTNFTYDRAGNLVSMQDSAGRSSTTSYDEFGRITASTDQDGVRTTFRYDSADPAEVRFGRAQAITKSDSGAHRFQYDASGNVELYTNASGATQRYLRDERGFPFAVLDEEGTAWRWQWSLAGELVAEGPGELRRGYSYDALGRLATVRLADEAPVHFRRDENGNPLEMQLDDGRTVAMQYDEEDQLIVHIDPVGRTARWTYDGLRYPIEKTEPGGARIRYVYDRELRPVKLINAAGEEHRLEYDSLGRLVAEVGFDGKLTRFVYDGAGYLESVDDGGVITRFARDQFGRVLEKQFADGSTHRFAWAPNNRVTSAITPDCVLTFEYDAMQRIIAERQDEFGLEHDYDVRGRLVATTLPDGQEIRYDYTSTDDCSEIRFGDRTIARFAHDAQGRPVRRFAGATMSENEFDPQGRLIRQSALLAGQATRREIVTRHYAYGADDNLLEVADSARGRLTYRYDERERLQSTDGWAPERFIYDLTDNLIAAFPAAEVDEATERAVPRAAGNRIQVFGDRAFSYDQRGNIIRQTSGAGGVVVTEFRYGANDMLVEVTRSGRKGQTTTRYGYDALNRRVSKSTTVALKAGNDAAPEPSEHRIRYLWNGDVPVAESGDADDPLQTVYLYELYSFRPLALLQRTERQDYAIYYYNNDPLGMPQELMDEDGRIAWSATYRAWGTASISARDGLAQPLRFPGQYYDDESGLHYNRNRYYHPDIGRFIQPDPISLLGGMNAYAYATNPNAVVDPFGLVPLDATGYSVYHIVDAETGRVAYVGITNDTSARPSGHRGTGRLGPGYEFEVQRTGLTYAQARGYEQADIERYGTRDTSRRGQPMRAGEPNRAWSFDPSRTDERARAFNEHYEERMGRRGGCG